MPSAILDGQARFGCSLVEFYRQPMLVLQAGRYGIMIAAPSEVDEGAEHALASVNALLDGTARWIATCPDCRIGAEYVWLAQPLMFCMACCNRALGGRWRRVDLPSERAEIERLLLLRSDPRTRSWTPGETLEQVAAANRLLAGGGV